jgi:hypothetical protein
MAKRGRKKGSKLQYVRPSGTCPKNKGKKCYCVGLGGRKSTPKYLLGKKSTPKVKIGNIHYRGNRRFLWAMTTPTGKNRFFVLSKGKGPKTRIEVSPQSAIRNATTNRDQQNIKHFAYDPKWPNRMVYTKKKRVYNRAGKRKDMISQTF